MQNKILELAKSYKEELLRKNEMEYATKKPGIGEEYYANINGIDSVCDGIACLPKEAQLVVQLICNQ